MAFYLIDFTLYYNKKDIIFHDYVGIPSGNNLALFDYMTAEVEISCDFWWTGKVVDSEVADLKKCSRYARPQRFNVSTL